MPNLFIDSAGARIKISSNDPTIIKDIKNSEFLKRYIPAFSFIEKSDYDCSLNLVTRSGENYLLNYPESTVQCGDLSVIDIATITEYLLERARQERGIDCLHSSSTAINNRGVIFWGGASGMGKTRMALCLSKNFGGRMISDEKTLLDLENEKILGGVGTIYFSKKFYEGEDKFSHISDRQKFFENMGRPLFVHAYVEDSDNFFWEVWDKEKAEWHLYEELSRKIRGTSRRIKDNAIPLLSIDSFEGAYARSQRVKNFCQKHDFHYMRGNEKKIAQKVIVLTNEQ